jgi:flavin reductase (DIM6/NTAB) family NADH-FMN oxidoreductase RutF
MISNSALRASLVPTIPRLLVIVSKRNLTHSLICNSRAFALHLLRTDQLKLVRRLGFFSGRDGDKLDLEDYTTGKTGSPILKDALAYFDCQVVNAMDNGGGTCFLGTVAEAGRLSEGDLMTSDYFRRHMPGDWLPLYEKQLREAQEFGLEYRHSIDYTPWEP